MFFFYINHPKKNYPKVCWDLRFMIMRAEKTRNIKKRQQNFVPRSLSVRLLGVAAKGTGGSKVFFFFWGGFGWEKTYNV